MNHVWQIAILGSALVLTGAFGGFYATQHQPALISIDSRTGKLAWAHPAKQLYYSRGPIVSNGKVLLNFCDRSKQKTCDHLYLQALDAQSGKLLWTYQPTNVQEAYKTVSSPSIVFQNGQLYLQVDDELRSVNLATGQQRWAIKRPWFGQSVSYGLGVVTTLNTVTVLRRNQRQRIVQSLNPQSGAVLKQFSISIPELSVTKDLMTASAQTLFLETSGLKPAPTKGNFYDSGTSLVKAYDLKTGQTQFQTTITGTIERIEALQNGLLISAWKPQTYGSLLALEASSGQILWQKTKQSFNCLSDNAMAVEADTVYLYCKQPKRSDSAQVVALGITGQTKWQFPMHPYSFSRHFPIAVNNSTLIAFRNQNRFLQAFGLNRTTGKLMWTFRLNDDRFVDQFRSVIATEGERLFILDELPRWQVWQSAIKLKQ